MKILFIDGTQGYRPTRLEESPTGGIATSLTIIPRLLAKYHGYECTVASHHPIRETIDYVTYSPLTEGQEKPDVVVFNRNLVNKMMLQAFNCPSILWLHDFVQFGYFEDSACAEVSKIVALSQYCMDSYGDFFGLSPGKFEVIPNGVDKDVFYPPRKLRNRNLYVMASAPVKGLQALPELYSQMKRVNPNFELRLYSSQKLHDLDNSQYDGMLNHLRSIGVNVCEPIPQKELAEVFREAWALMMVGNYPEICSNVLLQARACGLPVIASSIGSVPEFLVNREEGLLTITKPHDMYWFQKEVCQLAIELYQSVELHRKLSSNTIWRVHGWPHIANKWHEMIQKVSLERAA